MAGGIGQEHSDLAVPRPARGARGLPLHPRLSGFPSSRTRSHQRSAHPAGHPGSRFFRSRPATSPDTYSRTRFEPRSYGFRPGRGCQDAIRAIYMTCKAVWPSGSGRLMLTWPRRWVHGHTAPLLISGSEESVLRAGISIHRPFLRPVRVRTARSSPRLTFCNTVWREMPRARLA
jgi:hypothetical protein